MGFWENSWKCFLKKIPANFQKRFFWQSFYKMGLNWYYYLRTLKKLELWGLLQNYMGVFGKKFHRFQERSNWKSSCSMISNILTVKKAQNFSEGSNFSFFSGKTEGFFEKNLIFWKTDTVVKFVLEGVRSIAFAWEVSKRKRSDFRFSCENRWFFSKKTYVFSKWLHVAYFLFKKCFKWSFWMRLLIAFKKRVFLKKPIIFLPKILGSFKNH